MKKIFTAVILFLACFNAKGQPGNSAIFDFDVADTFHYTWGGANKSMYIGSQLFIDTIGYRHNEWQIGMPHKKIFNSAYSLPNAIVTDTSLSCLPNDTSVFILKLPYAGPLYVWAIEYISFEYKLNIDSGDIALVEASVDSCKTWTNMVMDTGSYWGVINKPDLSVSTSGWDSVAIYVNLPFVTPDTIYMRFTFITGNNSKAREGWMIDQIIAQHYSGVAVPVERNNNNISYLYPNPATKEVKLKFTTALNTDCQLTAVDALGKRVFTDKLNKGSTEYILNVGDWVNGIYFIEINGGNGNRTTQKLMVE